MLTKKDTAPAPARVTRDPFALLRQVTSEFDRVFDEPWRTLRMPAFRFPKVAEGAAWLPEIDVFERDNLLVTKVDLPGLKKEDVKVEVSDGYLTIFGERRTEAEEKKENFYRSERQFGSFYRAVPLPEGVKFEDVKATFTDGVLEVTAPLPPAADTTVHKIDIEETPKAVKAA